MLWAQDNVTLVDVVTQSALLSLGVPPDISSYSFTPTTVGQYLHVLQQSLNIVSVLLSVSYQ